ncbi:MAG: head completion/stabilization protein [Candidatus Reddybacter sp.]
MSFVPSGQPGISPTPALANIGFYPAISPNVFRQQLNVDSTVDEQQVESVLQLSMLEVNQELAAWQTAQEALGTTQLSDTTSVTYGTGAAATNKNVQLYTFAVQHLAKARVLERMRNFDSTASGINKTSEMDTPIGDYRREARRCVRAIMGQTGTVVELI